MRLTSEWKSTKDGSRPTGRAARGTFRDISFVGLHPKFIDDVDSWCIQNDKSRSFVLRYAHTNIWCDEAKIEITRSQILDAILDDQSYVNSAQLIHKNHHPHTEISSSTWMINSEDEFYEQRYQANMQELLLHKSRWKQQIDERDDSLNPFV